MPTDEPLIDELDRAGVSYQIVLTKADKVKPDELAAVEASDRRGDPQAPGRASASSSPRRAKRATGSTRCASEIAAFCNVVL